MSKILDNPKAFLEKLSKEEFKELLDEYGFEYIDKDDFKDIKNK